MCHQLPGLQSNGVVPPLYVSDSWTSHRHPSMFLSNLISNLWTRLYIIRQDMINISEVVKCSQSISHWCHVSCDPALHCWSCSEDGCTWITLAAAEGKLEQGECGQSEEKWNEIHNWYQNIISECGGVIE